MSQGTPEEEPPRWIQNILVVMMLIALSIGVYQVSEWNRMLWYPKDELLCGGPCSRQAVHLAEDTSSIGIDSISAAEEFAMKSRQLLSRLKAAVQKGAPLKVERTLAPIVERQPTAVKTGARGKAIPRKPKFKKKAVAMKMVEVVRNTIQHAAEIHPKIVENITFAINSADKIKYQLDNFEPMKHKFCDPQWNDISLASQQIARNRPGATLIRKRNLMVGISSVNRKQNYLLTTLESFFKECTAVELLDLKIVVFNADIPPTKHKDIPKVRERFRDHIESGLLTIIEREDGDRPYPEMENANALAIRWGDSLSRVQWRSKQVLDVAFLMDHAQRNDDGFRYFLMMEDDIQAAKRWPTRVRNWLDSKLHADTDWTMASFYNPWEGVQDKERLPPYKFFGVIGQVFRLHDLPVVVEFLRKNFDQSPLDWLFVDFLKKFNGTVVVSVPSLFQHEGTVSSLEGKIQQGRSVDFAYEPTYKLH